MSEPTKEAIAEARALRVKYAIHSGVIMYDAEVAQIIAHVRKQARDDALETVRQCERRSGACVMVHSLLNPEHPNLCNEENCSSIRAMNRL